MTLRIEPTKESNIEVDGDVLRTVWGQVFRTEMARAVYYFRWRERTPEPVEVVLSMGDWEDGAEASSRKCVAMHARRHEGQFAFMLIDAGDTSFSEHEFLGVMCRAKDVRGKDVAREAFAIVDAILEGDERVQELRASLSAN